MRSVRCPQCNEIIPPVNFCLYCGYKLDHDIIEPETKGGRLYQSFWLAIFTIFLLSLRDIIQIFVMIVFVFLGSSLIDLNNEIPPWFILIINITSSSLVILSLEIWYKKKLLKSLFSTSKSLNIYSLFVILVISITSIEFMVFFTDLFLNIFDLEPITSTPYDVYFKDTFSLIAFICLILLIGPLLEEIIYRFFIVTILQKVSDSWFTSSIISAFIFSLSHTLVDLIESSLRYTFLHLLTTFLLGIVLSLIFIKWGLIPAVLFHSLWNGYSLFSQLLIINNLVTVLDLILIVFFLFTILTAIIMLFRYFSILNVKKIKFSTSIHQLMLIILNLFMIIIFLLPIPLFLYSTFETQQLALALIMYPLFGVTIGLVLLNKDKVILSHLFS
ncbi:CPBP family glutamic-type intramembrane protease [Candidatus Hodarchaeum mangrovi]